MIKLCFVVVVALWCGSLVSGQVRSDLVKGNFPTKSELDNILSERATVEKLVNCITAVEFDRANCDNRLEEAHASAVEYFTTGENCRPPLCTEEESELVKYFVKNLSRRYSSIYKRMIDGIFDRQSNTDYGV